MSGRKEIPRELSIYINDRQVINSLGGVTREIGKVNSEMRNLNKNSATYDEDLKRLQKDLAVLKDRQAEFKEEIQATAEVSNEAAEAVSKIFIGLTSGNLNMAREGIEGIRGSVSGLTKSAMAFIATPIGAAIAVLSGIAIAAKAVFDFNKGLEESNKQLKALGVSSSEISKVRSEIEATAETFDKEFNEIAGRANSLSQSFGISMSEANQIIAEGLANGGAQNSEFLDSLGEYDEFFSKAGFSAQEFINIINTGFELGIYTDKLPDALKEADLSLKEQTKASRDALVNAFGASFTDDVLNKVRTGELTTKQALQSIAAESQKAQLSQQQQAQLTADIFKGAGEDAGGALKIFQAIGQSASKEMSATAQAQLELVEANERLNKAQAELFEIEGFGSMWDVIKAKSTDALSSILEWIIELKNDTQPLIDLVGILFVVAWENLKATTEVVFDFIGGLFRAASNTIKTFVDFFKAIFKGDFGGALEAIKNGFFNLGAIVRNTFGGIYNVIVGALQGIVKAVSPILESLGIDVDKLQKKLESFKVKEVKLKTSVSTEDDKKQSEQNIIQNQVELDKIAKAREEARKKEEAERQKALAKKKADEEKAAKETLDRQVALANALARVAKAELDYFILTNKGKVDTSKEITAEILAAETNRLNAIQEAQLDQLNKEREANIAKAQREAKSVEEFNALRLAFDTEYDNKRLEMESATLDAISVLKRTKEEQEKQLRLEQLAYDNELALLEAQSTEEAATIKRQQQYDKEAAEYFDALSKKKITYEEYLKFINALDKKKAEDERLAKIQDAANTLNELGKLADATVAIFGQNKASASATALINGGLAITEILKTPSTLPEPFASISRGIQITAAGISTAKAISQINSAKPPKRAKFFFGGPTGNTAALGNDEFGKMTGVVHENEWVAPQAMTQSPRYAPILSYLESERQKIYGNKFADGGEASPGTLIPGAPVQTNDPLLSAINRLNANLESGIKATALIGYQDAEDIKTLTEETSQSNQNGTLNQ